MHELSIIASIVRIAEEEVRKSTASTVEKIEMEIGELAGVEWNALDFAWEVGVQRSVLEHSLREVKRIPGQGHCLECGAHFPMQALYDNCPTCGSYFKEVIQGKELNIKSLTLI